MQDSSLLTGMYQWLRAPGVVITVALARRGLERIAPEQERAGEAVEVQKQVVVS